MPGAVAHRAWRQRARVEIESVSNAPVEGVEHSVSRLEVLGVAFDRRGSR